MADKLFGIYRYLYGEGEIIDDSRELIEGLFPSDQKKHAEWVASVYNRNAQAEEAPYFFQCEEVSWED